MECWKCIDNYPWYEVSNMGNVRSLDREFYQSNGALRRFKGKILKPQQGASRYYQVRLSNLDGYKVFNIHQLVAMAFLNHKPDGHKIVVDHINNNPIDNRVENLQLISHRQNISKQAKGSSKYTGVYWDNYKNKWVAEIRIKNVKKKLGAFTCELKAHLAYKKELNAISRGM